MTHGVAERVVFCSLHRGGGGGVEQPALGSQALCFHLLKSICFSVVGFQVGFLTVLEICVFFFFFFFFPGGAKEMNVQRPDQPGESAMSFGHSFVELVEVDPPRY